MDRMEKLKEFLKDNPEDAFVKHAMALEYIKSGDDAAARGLLEEILGADPSYTGSYYQLAKLLERNGQKESAIGWYKKGMVAAKAAGEKRTYHELQTGLEDLEDG
jgi:Tfp pilus assembly protein PilF